MFAIQATIASSVFTNARNSANGAASAFQLNNLNQPQGIIISQQTGEIYIANTGSFNVLRLPEYDSFIGSSTPNSYPINDTLSTQTAPLSVALYSDTADLSDNQIVAEAANRITVFLPAAFIPERRELQLSAHGAGNARTDVPQWSAIQFTDVVSSFSPNNLPLPWRTTVNDIQILVSAPGMTPTPAPIFRIDPTLIAFQVPASTPPSGTANFVVFHPSTGVIVGEGDFQMARYSPGFFTAGNLPGTGQVRAFNNLNAGETCSPMPDCVINGPGANAISRDGTHTISFCLTGGGVFQNNPTDGEYAAPGNTADQPQLLSSTYAPSALVPPANVTYSGAGCGFPGGWQVNFLVSSLFQPSNTNVIALTIGDIPSSRGPSGTIQGVVRNAIAHLKHEYLTFNNVAILNRPSRSCAQRRLGF